MEQSVTLNQNDIKKIIALFIGCDEKNIIKSQYSYTVTGVTQEQIERLLQVQ